MYKKKPNQLIEIMQKWSIIKIKYLWRPWDVCLAIDWLEVAIVSHMNIINIKSGSQKCKKVQFIHKNMKKKKKNYWNWIKLW